MLTPSGLPHCLLLSLYVAFIVCYTTHKPRAILINKKEQSKVENQDLKIHRVVIPKEVSFPAVAGCQVK